MGESIMKKGISEAKNLRWANSSKDALYMDLLSDGVWIPYCTTPNAVELHAQMLYNFAIQGMFGEIEDSDEEKILRGDLPPPEGCIVKDGKILNVIEQERIVADEINRRLSQLNTEEAKALAELDPKYAQERKKKMEHLLTIRNQKGYPFEVKWE